MVVLLGGALRLHRGSHTQPTGAAYTPRWRPARVGQALLQRKTLRRCTCVVLVRHSPAGAAPSTRRTRWRSPASAASVPTASNRHGSHWIPPRCSAGLAGNGGGQEANRSCDGHAQEKLLDQLSAEEHAQARSARNRACVPQPPAPAGADCRRHRGGRAPARRHLQETLVEQEEGVCPIVLGRRREPADSTWRDLGRRAVPSRRVVASQWMV
jgi:hypothetical protein